MGCWAIHSFANDDAADFLLDLQEGEDLSLVRAMIATVLEADDYLEAPEASQAIAAVEVVAAAHGNPTSTAQSEEDLIDWIDRMGVRPDPTLVTDAIRTLDRILGGNSELRELWEESEDFEAWKADVAGLRARLAG